MNQFHQTSLLYMVYVTVFQWLAYSYIPSFLVANVFASFKLMHISI